MPSVKLIDLVHNSSANFSCQQFKFCDKTMEIELHKLPQLKCKLFLFKYAARLIKQIKIVICFLNSYLDCTRMENFKSLFTNAKSIMFELMYS